MLLLLVAVTAVLALLTAACRDDPGDPAGSEVPK
jgi:hypothetical protein